MFFWFLYADFHTITVSFPNKCLFSTFAHVYSREFFTNTRNRNNIFSSSSMLLVLFYQRAKQRSRMHETEFYLKSSLLRLFFLRLSRYFCWTFFSVRCFTCLVWLYILMASTVYICSSSCSLSFSLSRSASSHTYTFMYGYIYFGCSQVWTCSKCECPFIRARICNQLICAVLHTNKQTKIYPRYVYLSSEHRLPTRWR